MDQVTSMDEWAKILGHYEHDGITFTWLSPPKTWEHLQKFEVRDDDIFLITYPKSGSHWMMEILQLLHHDAQADQIDRSNLDTALEIGLCRPDEVDTAIPGYQKMNTWSSPRIILTHCFEHLLPPQVWEKQVKIIHLVRNPKDVAVSAFHFIRQLLPPFLNEINAYVEYFLTDKYWGGSWFRHTLGYIPKHKNENVLFVTYEDLHKDLRGEIARVNAHLGHPITEDKLDKVTELASFSGMKQSYKSFDQSEEDRAANNSEAKPEKIIPADSYLRKGKIGNWKEHFNKDINEKFDHVYQEQMTGSGITLQFE